MKRFFATVIWRFAPADFKGNNWHLLQLAEHLDMAELTITEFDSKQSSKFQRLEVKVEGSYSDTKRMEDFDAVEWHINERINATPLPSAYLILMDEDKTEINPNAL